MISFYWEVIRGDFTSKSYADTGGSSVTEKLGLAGHMIVDSGEILIWWCPKIGVPLVIIHSRLGFSLTKTNQLWGYPHDELETPIYR